MRIRSCSIFWGSSFFVSSNRREIRCTCVSTTTPSALPNHVPSTTFAVLRATPGNVSKPSMLSGTLPPNSLTTLRAAPTTDFDLLRKNPVDRISGSSCCGSSRAKSCTVGYFLNSSGVTMFTRTSVDCAERMVATTSSHASLCVNAQVTSGYCRSSRCRMSETRSGARGLYPPPTLLFSWDRFPTEGAPLFVLFKGGATTDARFLPVAPGARTAPAFSWRPVLPGRRGVIPLAIHFPQTACHLNKTRRERVRALPGGGQPSSPVQSSEARRIAAENLPRNPASSSSSPVVHRRAIDAPLPLPLLWKSLVSSSLL